MSPELELVSSLLTSFLEGKYYESGKQREQAIINSINKVSPLFAAKASIFARTEYGMRSVSHLTAATLADKIKGSDWGKRYYDKVVFRPDDITEILALVKTKQSHAMRKGFARALARFDAYQLAKYRGEGKSVKLVDAVNLTHPKGNEALGRLVKDELRNTQTFEAKLSAAGSSTEAKAEAWADLLKSGKLGYFALLRNLRNIVEQNPEMIEVAVTQLVDAKAIRKSLVLPFRFMTAADELSKVSGPAAKKALLGISRALDSSVENIPKFEGESLVAMDTSSSMSGAPLQKATLFAAMLVKSNGSDLILWDTGAVFLTLNPSDSLPTLANQIATAANKRMGGTDIQVPFLTAKRNYSRIVVLTDEQSWVHSTSYYGNRGTGPSALADYRKRTGANPMVYQWDLAGHGTLQFPENQVATLAGWSDKVFSIMQLVETDKKALVHKIESIEL